MKPSLDMSLQHDTVPEVILSHLRSMESTMMEKRRISRMEIYVV